MIVDIGSSSGGFNSEEGGGDGLGRQRRRDGARRRMSGMRMARGKHATGDGT
jgi:hypothetical protein